MNRLTVATSVKKRVPSIAVVLAASLIIATVGGGRSEGEAFNVPGAVKVSIEIAK